MVFVFNIGSISLLTWKDVTNTASDFWNSDSAGLNKEVVDVRKKIRAHVKLLCAQKEVQYCRDDIARFKENITKDFDLLLKTSISTDDWVYKTYLTHLATSYLNLLSVKTPPGLNRKRLFIII